MLLKVDKMKIDSKIKDQTPVHIQGVGNQRKNQVFASRDPWQELENLVTIPN